MEAGCNSDKIEMYLLILPFGISISPHNPIGQRHTEVRSQALWAPSIAQLVSHCDSLDVKIPPNTWHIVGLRGGVVSQYLYTRVHGQVLYDQLLSGR